ncbi:unnamed protein product [Prorocentrum cordatum]|uniref:Ion transport domain-containing protein n=1 Tax=Prorocentrum cordatum TaxID=2364126 RepID=A0ABN9TBF4_9DINO|nr:unnamed protein product [Polarella glacialis]
MAHPPPVGGGPGGPRGGPLEAALQELCGHLELGQRRAREALRQVRELGGPEAAAPSAGPRPPALHLHLPPLAQQDDAALPAARRRGSESAEGPQTPSGGEAGASAPQAASGSGGLAEDDDPPRGMASMPTAPQVRGDASSGDVCILQPTQASNRSLFSSANPRESGFLIVGICDFDFADVRGGFGKDAGGAGLTRWQLVRQLDDAFWLQCARWRKGVAPAADNLGIPSRGAAIVLQGPVAPPERGSTLCAAHAFEHGLGRPASRVPPVCVRVGHWAAVAARVGGARLLRLARPESPPVCAGHCDAERRGDGGPRVIVDGRRRSALLKSLRVAGGGEISSERFDVGGEVVKINQLCVITACAVLFGAAPDVVKDSRYEICVMLLIVANSVFLGWQVEHEALTREPVKFEIEIEAFFCAVFSMELILKVFACGLGFFGGSEASWNCFDLFVVLLMLVDFFASISQEMSSSLWSQAAGLRIFRVLRVIRFLRSVRQLKFFTQLRIMIRSIMFSLKPLLWASLVLSGMFYVFGLCLTQGVIDHLQKTNSWDDASSSDMLQYFGTLERCALSLFEAMSGGINWGELFDTLSPLAFPFQCVFLFFVLFAIFGAANVVTGTVADLSRSPTIGHKMTATPRSRRNQSRKPSSSGPCTSCFVN